MRRDRAAGARLRLGEAARARQSRVRRAAGQAARPAPGRSARWHRLRASKRRGARPIGHRDQAAERAVHIASRSRAAEAAAAHPARGRAEPGLAPQVQSRRSRAPAKTALQRLGQPLRAPRAAKRRRQRHAAHLHAHQVSEMHARQPRTAPARARCVRAGRHAPARRSCRAGRSRRGPAARRPCAAPPNRRAPRPDPARIRVVGRCAAAGSRTSTPRRVMSIHFACQRVSLPRPTGTAASTAAVPYAARTVLRFGRKSYSNGKQPHRGGRKVQMVTASISMTGFASRGAAQGPGMTGPGTCASVNGKGLDLRLRLPDWIEGLEAAVRGRAGARRWRAAIGQPDAEGSRATDGGRGAAAEPGRRWTRRWWRWPRSSEARDGARGWRWRRPPRPTCWRCAACSTQRRRRGADTAPLRAALLADLAALLADFNAMRARRRRGAGAR